MIPTVGVVGSEGLVSSKCVVVCSNTWLLIVVSATVVSADEVGWLVTSAFVAS